MPLEAVHRHGRSAPLEIPVSLERGSGGLATQVADSLREAITDGRLPAGLQVPSTRALALQLAVSRTVTAEAYSRLLDEGHLVSRQGSGTYVQSLPRLTTRRVERPEMARRDESVTSAPTPSRPPVTEPLASKEWAAAWRHVARLQPPHSYLDCAGEMDLREALCEYLLRSRGLHCDPSMVVVTTGTQQSTDLLVRARLSAGRAFAFEEPGDPVVAQTARLNAVLALPIDVDQDGLRVQDLSTGRNAPRLVQVTPSHHFPLGHRMSISRRIDLVAWAMDNDAIVIEDDYDSEFRFDGPPFPTLFSLAPDRVAYVGTLSKVLTPALRLGYIVARPDVARDVAAIKEQLDGAISWPVQAAVAHLIRTGGLERHIRRQRQRYARVRAALGRALADGADVAEVMGLHAGVHAVIVPRYPTEIPRIVERLHAQGIPVTSLTAQYVGAPKLQGLLLRYGGLTEEQAVDAVAALIGDLRASNSA